MDLELEDLSYWGCIHDYISGCEECDWIAPDYEFDQDELLFFCTRSSTKSEYRVELGRLVIPEMLLQDSLHHYHTSLEGGHQGIGYIL